MFSILAVVSFTALALQASSLAVRSPSNSLVARQGPNTPDIPPECSAICDPILQTLDACTSDACACTADNGLATEACADCAIAVMPNLTTIAQGILDQYTANCSTAGLPFATPLTAVPSAPAPTVTA